MPELAIGSWVRRRGKWHLVDSVITDRAVTRCGREMHRVTNGGELEVRETMPLTRMIGQPQLCRYCDEFERDRTAMVEDIAKHSTTPSSEFVTLDEGTAALSFEDDLSTAPTEATDVP